LAGSGSATVSFRGRAFRDYAPSGLLRHPGHVGLKGLALVRRCGQETGAHVAIVHHGNKASNGTNPRGHSLLIGADDALIEVVKQVSRREATEGVRKQNRSLAEGLLPLRPA
jgi:hypothetical protein